MPFRRHRHILNTMAHTFYSHAYIHTIVHQTPFHMKLNPIPKLQLYTQHIHTKHTSFMLWIKRDEESLKFKLVYSTARLSAAEAAGGCGWILYSAYYTRTVVVVVGRTPHIQKSFALMCHLKEMFIAIFTIPIFSPERERTLISLHVHAPHVCVVHTNFIWTLCSRDFIHM